MKNRMMKRVLPSLILLVVLTGQAWAYLMSGNQRLDRAIYAKHDPKLIVAGQIADIKTEKRPGKDKEGRLVFYISPAEVSFQFKVSSVILGDGKYKGQTLSIPATSFMWPGNLLPFKTGTRCILVLRTGWGENHDGYYLYTVVPTGNTGLRSAKDGEDAKRVLAGQILAELENETSTNRQRYLVMQASPILTPKEADALIPFLQSKNTWLRRAALAGLVYATNKPEYLKMLHQDMEQYLNTTDPSSTVDDLEKGTRHSPLALLFSHYFFLSVGWSEEENNKASAYLSVFRLVAKAEKLTGDFEGYRWEHGIRPLCRLGTMEDVKTLYDYYQNRELRTISDSPHNREEILQGLSRILGLEFTRWMIYERKSREKEHFEAVRKALLARGIIKK